MQYKCIAAQPVYAHARLESAVNAVRPRRACLSAQEPVTIASHSKSVTSPAPAFFGRHVAPPPVANQQARIQCASRSFTKVFVGRRLAPLPAPGKYRCLSSARFVIYQLRFQLWHHSMTFAALRPVAPNTVRAAGRRRCLTLRSRRAPTAGRATASCYSGFRPACRWRHLTSNVRHHGTNTLPDS